MSKKRKRYSCCKGSLKCSLNVIERAADKVLALYRKNKRKGREALLNWVLDVDETIDYLKLKVKQLQQEKIQTQYHKGVNDA